MRYTKWRQHEARTAVGEDAKNIVHEARELRVDRVTHSLEALLLEPHVRPEFR
eukprot:SAG11_NODE_3048_length_2733_cov_1.307897_4_plen_53_part_00